MTKLIKKIIEGGSVISNTILCDLNEKMEVGDIVEYRTRAIRSLNGGYKAGVIKTGKIAEAFHTLDGFPCYWIENEKELICREQIRKKLFVG